MGDDHASATDLLLRAGAGETSAAASIFPLVYDELRRPAHIHLAKESTGRTLGTTELVHVIEFVWPAGDAIQPVIWLDRQLLD